MGGRGIGLDPGGGSRGASLGGRGMQPRPWQPDCARDDIHNQQSRGERRVERLSTTLDALTSVLLVGAVLMIATQAVAASFVIGMAF